MILFHLTFIVFTAFRNCCILHGHVFVMCFQRISLLYMNGVVCTKLAIISVRNCIKGHFDPSDNKGGGHRLLFVLL